jgi:hypothetical protein
MTTIDARPSGIAPPAVPTAHTDDQFERRLA